MKKEDMKMDLQLFAEGGEDQGNDDGDDSNSDDNGKDGAEGKDTFSKEEFEAKLQAETDRRVTQALQKQEKKMESKMKEAEKLRNMSDEQAKQYKLEQREKELTNKEKEYALMENKVECSKILEKKGLPSEFLDYVVAEDAETMLDNINKMELMFNSAVEDKVNSKIDKKTPAGSKSEQKGMTKEKWADLNLAQQNEVYKNNHALWKKMQS